MTRSKKVGKITYLLGENTIENHKILNQTDKNYWWFHLNDLSGHCIVNTEKINNNIITIAGNYIKSIQN